MAIKGMFDTVTILEKVQTTDGRGGVSTTYTTKISSLVCSLQTIRREEVRNDPQGVVITNATLMTYETITSGPVVEIGNVVYDGNVYYLVEVVTITKGKGAHSEATLKDINGDSLIS